MAVQYDEKKIGQILWDQLNGMNFDPVYNEIGEILTESIDTNFYESGRYGEFADGGWKGGSKRWIPSARALGIAGSKWRKKKGKGKTLIDSGRLAASITYTVSSDGVVVGTNVFYAPFLHYGTKRMPARPILVIQDEDFTEIERAVGDFLEKEF